MTPKESINALEIIAASLRTQAENDRELGPSALDFVADQIEIAIRGLKE